MRRQTMRMGTTCVVLLMLAATLGAQERLQPEQPAAPARGWALTASAPAETELPGLVLQEGPGVRIRAPRE